MSAKPLPIEVQVSDPRRGILSLTVCDGPDPRFFYTFLILKKGGAPQGMTAATAMVIPHAKN